VPAQQVGDDPPEQEPEPPHQRRGVSDLQDRADVTDVRERG
jgi:hypothetical protein